MIKIKEGSFCVYYRAFLLIFRKITKMQLRNFAENYGPGKILKDDKKLINLMVLVAMHKPRTVIKKALKRVRTLPVPIFSDWQSGAQAG